MKLLADPTNQINETSDLDNEFTTDFVWDGQTPATPLTGMRLPNLSVIGTIGDVPSIVAAPVPNSEQSGGLSIHGDTYISVTVSNDSPITIAQDFFVYLLFDDVVVHRERSPGLIGGSTWRFDWNDLASEIQVAAGLHKLKLILDPTENINENNEADNVYEIDLIWGAGPPIKPQETVLTSNAPIRETRVLPNIKGFVPYGWDAAITVNKSEDPNDRGKDGDVWSAEDTLISFAVQNNSLISTDSLFSETFRVDILIDDELIDSTSLSTGSDANAVWEFSIVLPADQLTAGQHLLKLLIDSDNKIAEDNEADNSVARYVEWLAGPPSIETLEVFTLSNQQLDQMLEPILDHTFIDQMRSSAGSNLALPDWESVIRTAAKAGFYLLTGRDLDAERVVAHLLPKDQFVAASINSCMFGYMTMSDTVYSELYTSCIKPVNRSGFETRVDGQNHIYIDMNTSPMEVLSTYFHELGHSVQDLTNPTLTEAHSSDNIRGLMEAQAYIFEAAALRAIEEYSGTSLMKFPDNPAMRTTTLSRLEETSSLSKSPEHDLGYKMLWMESLANTSGIGTHVELPNNKRLSASSAKELYDYLVAMKPTDVDSWVEEIFAVTNRTDQFMAISLNRLERDLSNTEHGNPALLGPGLLAP